MGNVKSFDPSKRGSRKRKQKQQQDKKTYSDYEALFVQKLGKTGLDIFTGQLMYWSHQERLWAPVNDRPLISYFRSLVREQGDEWSVSAVEDHLLGMFSRYVPGAEPGQSRQPRRHELLIDVPEWDGHDYILDFASCIHPINCTQQHFYEYLKHWLVYVVLKIRDPLEQNRCLILQSDKQGLGKDTWVKHLLNGFGQFLKPFTIQSQEHDNFQSVTSGAIMHVAELDKMKADDQAKIKNLITADECYFRASYGRTHQHKRIRASWIATTNEKDIFKDHTGNRRYAMFEISRIDWDYPKGVSGQVIAQARYLANQGYRASDETLAIVDAYIKEKTPEDTKQLIYEDFLGALANHRSGYETEFRSWDIKKPLEETAKAHGLRGHRYVQTILKERGHAKRTGRGMIYEFDSNLLKSYLNAVEENDAASMNDEKGGSLHENI